MSAKKNTKAPKLTPDDDSHLDAGEFDAEFKTGSPPAPEAALPPANPAGGPQTPPGGGTDVSPTETNSSPLQPCQLKESCETVETLPKTHPEPVNGDVYRKVLELVAKAGGEVGAVERLLANARKLEEAVAIDIQARVEEGEYLESKEETKGLKKRWEATIKRLQDTLANNEPTLPFKPGALVVEKVADSKAVGPSEIAKNYEADLAAASLTKLGIEGKHTKHLIADGKDTGKKLAAWIAKGQHREKIKGLGDKAVAAVDEAFNKWTMKWYEAHPEPGQAAPSADAVHAGAKALAEDAKDEQFEATRDLDDAIVNAITPFIEGKSGTEIWPIAAAVFRHVSGQDGKPKEIANATTPSKIREWTKAVVALTPAEVAKIIGPVRAPSDHIGDRDHEDDGPSPEDMRADAETVGERAERMAAEALA